jgi:hypothetical protein
MQHSTLLEQVTVRHGPSLFLAQFFVEAVLAAQQFGVALSIEHDAEALFALNAANRDSWHPLPTMFDPAYHDLDPKSFFWVAARNAQGELIGTYAVRTYDWQETSLAAELSGLRMHYARPERDAPAGETWATTVPEATEIGGRIACHGGLWLKPARRHAGLAPILCHVAHALAWTAWLPDFSVTFIVTSCVRRGFADQYGFRYMKEAVTRRHSPRGDVDLALCWLPRGDFRNTLEAMRAQPAFTARTTETSVATVEPSRRRQGSMSLS